MSQNDADRYKATLTQRRDYLTMRIMIKQQMTPPWDVEWDTRERDATMWALEVIEYMNAH